MTPDLRELYQSVILDHHKRPRNYGQLADANHRAEGNNPLCGDRVRIELKMDGDVIKDIHFVGSGCAISTAAASLMTEALKGHTRAEAEALYERFHTLLTRDEDPGDDGPGLGKLEAFSGVREFPVRVKCATLPWHTFRAALKDDSQPVSTE